MRKFLVFVATLIFTSSSIALASNANPPVITSVEQITKGPYSVGDVVSYKVSYTGGEPGLQSVNIQFNGDCLYSDEIRGLGLRVKEEGAFKSPDFKIISGWVKPCPISTVQPISARITDLTRLIATKELNGLTDLALQINPSNLLPTPVGEIKPKKLKDSLDINFIPASPKTKQVYELPRLTLNGVPIFWRVVSTGICKINTAFDGDLGGSLVILKTGNCTLRIMAASVDKYEFPAILTKAKLTKGPTNALLNFSIKK